MKLRRSFLFLSLVFVLTTCNSLSQNVVCHAESPSRCTNEPNRIGQLKIEGKYITQIKLIPQNGKPLVLKSPSEVVLVPAGKYRIDNIQLQGNFGCYYCQKQFTIMPNQVTSLNIGAPLTPSINIEHRGALLTIGYELWGIGGECYDVVDTSKPPKFHIFKNQKPIGGDKFVFG